MDFNKPIPGQSLTEPPRKHRFERPPEVTDPEEAIQMHLTRLNTDEMKQNIVDLIETDPEIDIVTITNGILRSAVASGIHSIDVSLIVAPVVHEFIRQVAEISGVEYDEGLEDKKALEEGRKKINKAKAATMVQKALKEEGPLPEDKPEVAEGDPEVGFFTRRKK